MTEFELSIMERLVRMETKMDAYATTSTDHEGRIRKLEQWRWSFPATIGAVAGLGASLLPNLLGAA